MVLVDGRKYGLREGELPGVPSDADLTDDIILTARLDGEPLLTASRDGHAQKGRVSVPLKVRRIFIQGTAHRQQQICCITSPLCVYNSHGPLPRGSMCLMTVTAGQRANP